VAGYSRPFWGWHSLTDRWAGWLVADAGVRPGDLVVDVGAGGGSLTEHLVAAGARVIAVELHAGRAAELRERFRDDPVTVVQADACDLRLPRRPFRVIANPPFATTRPLLCRLVSPGSRLVDAHLVVARHVARRWASDDAPGAGRWRATFTASVRTAVPRTAFRPPPPRDAALLVLAPAGATRPGAVRRRPPGSARPGAERPRRGSW